MAMKRVLLAPNDVPGSPGSPNPQGNPPDPSPPPSPTPPKTEGRPSEDPPDPPPPLPPPAACKIVVEGQKTEREMRLEADLDTERKRTKGLESKNAELEDTVSRLRGPREPIDPFQEQKKSKDHFLKGYSFFDEE